MKLKLLLITFILIILLGCQTNEINTKIYKKDNLDITFFISGKKPPSHKLKKVIIINVNIIEAHNRINPRRE